MSMIPPFDETGCLPPGIYRATIDEIDARFGRQSEIRQSQMDSICWMLDLARRAGVQRIILNGSFTTDIIEPNDVDCVLLIARKPPPDPSAEEELAEGLPFLDITLAGPRDFAYFADRFFAFDRSRQAKGMIEIIL